MTTSALSTYLRGRGLWYGPTISTSAQFDALFAQARAWGIQVVHPKVADGAHLWYSVLEMHDIKAIADKHGLVCVPYHYCYGDTWHALDEEAQVTATIGNVFGAVIPDIEIEWEQHPEWAVRYGTVLRSHFTGEVLVTTFANWLDHPVPYKQINAWANGFLPQAYFDVWNNARTGAHMSAQDALLFLYPQWLAVSDALAASEKTLVPIYPIIELGNKLSTKEVQNWLVATNKYGYCGFWLADEYGPYADAIKSVAVPGQPTSGVVAAHPTTPPAPAPHPTTPPPAVPSHDPAPVPHQKELTASLLTDAQLALLWHSAAKDMVLNPTSAIYTLWASLIRNSQPIGAPLSNEQRIEFEGEKMTWIPCTSGKKIVYFFSNGITCVL